jgi:hypothetical protein
VEANAHAESAKVAEEGQPMVTVMMKEKISESAQGEEEEEHIDDMLTPWEIELRMLEDGLDNPEPRMASGR